MYKIKTVAQKLLISEVTVRRLIRDKKIPFHKIGKIYRFTEQDISSYLSETAVVPMKEGGK